MGGVYRHRGRATRTRSTGLRSAADRAARRSGGRRLGVAERAVGAGGCGWTVPGVFRGAADLDAGAAVPGVHRTLDRREVDGGEVAERFPVEGVGTGPACA